MRKTLSGNKMSLLLSVLSLGMLVMLYACGGGGGGGSDEVPLDLGLDGPGDEGNYFPLTVGNLWQFQGTEISPEGSRQYRNTVSVTGTRNIDGIIAQVVQDTNSYGDGPFESYVVKDLNGIANIGTSDADPFGVQLAYYWEGRFPLIAGESFVQIDRSGVDFGEDLDDDGTNEKVDVRSVVTVVGFSSVTTPVGNFSDTVHIAKELTLTLRMSSDGSRVPVTATEDSIFATGIGWLERRVEISLLGETITTHETLTAYMVDGEAFGIIQVPGMTVEGEGSPAGTDSYYAFDVTPGENLTVALTGLTDNADLIPLLPATCNQAYNLLPGTSPEYCHLTTTGSRLLVAVTALESASYLLSLSPTPVVTEPANEGTGENPVQIPPSTPTVGQVETRGTSYYVTTGLDLAAHTVSISGLSGDAALHVYADETYSFELDCTLRSSTTTCTVEDATALYFSVSSGPLNRDGASYTILVY
ncbi:MAG: hypothetical protein RQ754_06520 [Desulfuromonadales bacterium]|nr:hypothetical protein [Desulfuromonadales bacterium]